MIVPTRGRAASLPTTLAPLLADEATSELLVVLDGEEPHTEDLVNRLAKSDPRIRLAVIDARGAGGAGGRQAGAELGGGELLVFIDDDVVAEPELVRRHVCRHLEGGRRMVLGYMPVPLGPVRRPRDIATAVYGRGYEMTCKTFDCSPQNVLLNFWAGNFSIARSDALSVGIFDPAFSTAYHADRDFGLRCRAAGIEPVFDRSLLAQHHYKRSWRQFQSDSRRQGAGTLLIHTRHAEVVGPIPPMAFQPPGPRARRIFHAARRPRLRPLAQAGLTAGVALACAVRRPEMAIRGARLSQDINSYRGAVEVGSLRTDWVRPPHPDPSDAPSILRSRMGR